MDEEKETLAEIPQEGVAPETAPVEEGMPVSPIEPPQEAGEDSPDRLGGSVGVD